MNNFFINLLLLISVIFVGGHLLKDTPSECNLKIIMKVLLGFAGGALAIGMMTYTINIASTGTLIDLRIIALMLVYYIGGLLPSIVTGIITALFRTLYYGFSESSIVAIIQIVILIITYYMISRYKLNSIKKWTLMFLVSMFVSLSTYYYLLFDLDNIFIILIGYLFASTIAAVLAYYLLIYVKSSNELYRRYKSEATKDFLTGLYNTRQFDLAFNTSVLAAREKGEKLSCLMIDIDFFKNVNDTYGHAVGDIVLRELAIILKNTCRVFDITARVGGEEFCILLINCSEERAIEIGKRICDEVKRYKFDIGNNRHIRITVSVGVATYPDVIEDSDMLLKQADDSLYKAKQTGRDKVCSVNTCNI